MRLVILCSRDGWTLGRHEPTTSTVESPSPLLTQVSLEGISPDSDCWPGLRLNGFGEALWYEKWRHLFRLCVESLGFWNFRCRRGLSRRP
jgi:hypothetical protein